MREADRHERHHRDPGREPDHQAAGEPATRQADGYLVRIPGLASSFGHVQVTASDDGNRCKVVHWFASDADEMVLVRCWRRGSFNVQEDTPFILITAYGDAHVRREARALGAAAVIDKPFGFGELKHALQVKAHKFSAKAKEAIAKAGGTAEEIATR